ncbi:prepilin-type N-terminal cleavage/methylation domain-containing protein [Sporosarcina sp. HYO08]|uniref:type IV pilus modification PilV family protein n=1 Tax=Sporosarcina sp. HYO08 TaxID=1759557 RepID=UPI00079B137F|nr:type II secretion system protein [Sporosarcina sp. HYO08]KXH87301.1 hypothetical protein AU377_01630 [Sporosarcina sp. HYO08]
MGKLNKRIDERGLSLVEVLAAIVILSIVLVTFFSFFTQSTKYSKFNKEKLTAVQVAEEVVAKIRDIESQDEILGLDEFQLVGGLYVDTTTYPSYKVEINATPGPISTLGKAIITIESLSETGIKALPFTTEMYFNVSEETP